MIYVKIHTKRRIKSMNLILIIIILLLLYTLYHNKVSAEKKETEITNTNLQVYPYAKKNLLTKTEYAFYQMLKSECDQNNMLICPKVRLEDFISVTDKQNYAKYRGYIKSRHIDFLLCNAKLQIIGAIELDDNTHNNAKVQKTDELKDNIFKAISLPLFRVKTSESDYNAKIKAIISELNKK